MKRLVIALFVLAAGTTAVCVLRDSTGQVRRELAARGEAWRAETELVAAARNEHTEFTERLGDLKRTLSAQPPTVGTVAELLRAVESNGPSRLTIEQREKLLADLGFNWNSTGDYLVVSKDALPRMSLEGMKGMKLTETVCSVLAITPPERAALESMTQQLGVDFKAWAETHVQRAEPVGDVVAKYTMPADAAFSQSLSNMFSTGVLAALGTERGELLMNYARSWMSDLGMLGGKPTTMKVKRYQAGDEPRLGFEISQGSSIMSTEVSPHQPFPEAFRPLFPDGWADLAAREGFELPKSFKKNPSEP